MTELTTIKVPRQLRDRLRAVADARHTTMGGVLETLTAEAERAERFRKMAADLEAFAQRDPEDFAAYKRELAEWDEATAGDGLPAEDFSDYER